MIKGKPTKNNFLKVKDTIQKFTGHIVKIGLPAGTTGSYDGVSIIEVGAVHEYGSPARNIPQRSFLRVPMYINRDKIKKLIFSEYNNIINGKGDVMTSLHKMGAYGEGISKASFKNNDWTPVTTQTQKRKGESKTTTLIDTGQLRQSITFVVEKV